MPHVSDPSLLCLRQRSVNLLPHVSDPPLSCRTSVIHPLHAARQRSVPFVPHHSNALPHMRLTPTPPAREAFCVGPLCCTLPMNISLSLLLLLVLLCLGLGAALGYGTATMRTQAASQEHTRELSELQAREAAAQARAERLAEENNGLVSRSRADNDIMRAIAPLGRHLEAMEHRVQVMQETQAAQRAELHEQLEANGRGQRELAQETSSLRSVLISTSARGTWGEVELRRVVEAAGMLAHVDFSEQMSTGAVTNSASASRPDLTIHLPGGAHIAVDAKVPLSAILRAQDISGEGAREQAERERLLKEHAKALRAHITTLAKRNYPAEFPGSPQITVMFLPAESLLSQALAADGALLEDSLAAGVSPASPSSLLALLRSVAAVWSSTRIAEESQAIMELGRTLVKRLDVAAEHLGNLGTGLRRSVANYNKAIASLESRVLVTARSFDSIEVPLREVPQIEADDAQIRSFTVPELAQSDEVITS